MINRRITVRFGQQIADLMHELTDGVEESMSRMIRAALMEYLRKYGYLLNDGKIEVDRCITPAYNKSRGEDMSKGRATVIVRLDDEQIRDLKALAATKGLTVSDLVREGVNSVLAKYSAELHKK